MKKIPKIKKLEHNFGKIIKEKKEFDNFRMYCRELEINAPLPTVV